MSQRAARPCTARRSNEAVATSLPRRTSSGDSAAQFSQPHTVKGISMRMTRSGPRHAVRTELTLDEKRLLERHAASRGVSVATLLARWIAPRLDRLRRET